MVFPNNLTDIAKKPIAALMGEIEVLQEGLYEKLLIQDEDILPEEYQKLCTRQDELSIRIGEIYKRKLSQRINYWDNLKVRMSLAIKYEDIDNARSIQKRMQYFRHFLKDDLPKSYFL